MASIETKQNAVKEAPIDNRMKSPDFGWLNIDRYESYKYYSRYKELTSHWKNKGK